MKLSFAYFTGIILMTILIVTGCGGGGGPINDDPNRVPTTANLTLGSPEINGNEFSYPVMINDSVDVAAISFRLGFDPEKLEPVDVVWSDTIPWDDSTFHLLNADGFIPFAYAETGPEETRLTDGELCRVTFREITPGGEVWMIGDPDYLVAFTAGRESIDIIAGGDVR